MKTTNKILALLLSITIMAALIVKSEIGYTYNASYLLNFEAAFVVSSAIVLTIVAIVIPLPDKYGNYGFVAKILAGILVMYIFGYYGIIFVGLRLGVLFIKGLSMADFINGVAGGNKNDSMDDSMDDRRTDAQKNPIDYAINPGTYDIMGRKKW